LPISSGHDKVVAMPTIVDGAETVTVATAYSPDNRMVTETVSGGGAVSKTVDERGRLKTVNQDGNSVEFAYRSDNSIQTKSYDGRTIVYSYDLNNGRLIKAADGAEEAAFNYDFAGRMNRVVLPNNMERGFTFNAANELAAMTQTLNGAVTNYSYNYDAAGRLKKITAPNWTAAYGYDAAGRLESEARSGEGANRHSYSYDLNDNRIKQVSHVTPEVTGHAQDFVNLPLPPEVTIVDGNWTAGGELHAAMTTRAIGESSARTTLNLGINVVAPITVKVRPQAVNAAAGQAGIVYSGISFGEGVDGRYLISVAVENVGGILRRQLTLLWIPTNGFAEIIAQGENKEYNNEWLTIKLEFNEASIVANIVEDIDTGADPLIADAAHPLVGTLGLELRTGVSSPLIGVSADFDDLTWNTVSGGVETRNYTYNSMNQLKTISGSETSTFDYDYFGNLTRRTKDGAITDFAYDILNRQKSMTLNVGTQNAEQTLYSYYGPTWMRKTMQVGTGPATSYLHDGFACVSQTTAGVKTNYFVPGTSPLWETTNNQTVTYAQDGRGNITGLWTGNTYAAKFNYDAFGNVKTTDANNNPLANTSGPRYGGQFHDANTDQIYLRNRYYDPKIGAFNRIDPIGFNGGLNLYGYCAGDPVNASDPMGTFWIYMNNVEEAPKDGTVPKSVAAMQRRFGSKGHPKRMKIGDSYVYAFWVDRGVEEPAMPDQFDAVSKMEKTDSGIRGHFFEGEMLTEEDLGKTKEQIFDEKMQVALKGVYAATMEQGKAFAKELVIGVALDLTGAVVFEKVGKLFRVFKQGNNVKKAGRLVEDGLELQQEERLRRYKPTGTPDATLSAGEGLTDKYGNYRWSTKGTQTEQALAKTHEQVHSFLSPKAEYLREFRAGARMTGYAKSEFLRYVEEATAETVAQLRVNGATVSSIVEGLRFPIKEGYVTLKGVITEGAIGSVVIGGATYGVYSWSEGASK
jgi:RHS repeat-associated protein